MSNPPTRASLSLDLIVDTALKLISEHGADRLSMRHLSAALGVSLGATYRHVASKDELLVLCGRRLYERSYTKRAADEDPLHWVRDQVMHLYDLLVAHPGMARRVVFAGNVDPELAEDIRQALLQTGHSEDSVDTIGLVLTLYTAGALMASAQAEVHRESGSSTRTLIIAGLDFILHSYLDDNRAGRAPSVS
ncbi:hypothetical protein GCM10009798_34170 [Nocardioides panacihumi]|uniref:HTH tetR-type domain-containing protein n=1 Tax=Nocardioides panacihumi TaxID=400774 RepID=A0ABN2RK74_9ACTN